MNARLALALSLLVAASPSLVTAAGDPAEGKKLVEQAKCETCHYNKTKGDANSIYLRKNRIVTTWPKLKAQVAACNSQLNLGLFPDDEEHVAAYLNATYYKFAVK